MKLILAKHFNPMFLRGHHGKQLSVGSSVVHCDNEFSEPVQEMFWTRL